MPEIDGMYYPDLKPLDKAVVFSTQTRGSFYHYEPGNGTRYEVFLTKRNRTDHPHDEYYPVLTVAVMNFDRPCSMTLPFPDAPLDKHNIDYMVEKMKILPGDAWALIPLVNQFIAMEHLAEEAGLV